MPNNNRATDLCKCFPGQNQDPEFLLIPVTLSSYAGNSNFRPGSEKVPAGKNWKSTKAYSSVKCRFESESE